MGSLCTMFFVVGLIWFGVKVFQEMEQSKKAADKAQEEATLKEQNPEVWIRLKEIEHSQQQIAHDQVRMAHDEKHMTHEKVKGGIGIGWMLLRKFLE